MINKDDIIFVINILVCVLLIVTGCQFMVGLGESNDPGCGREIRRIEYVFPGFRIGCYMGGRVK